MIDVLALGYLGAIPPEGSAIVAAKLFTLYYFAHFLLVMPIVRLDRDTKADAFQHIRNLHA